MFGQRVRRGMAKTEKDAASDWHIAPAPIGAGGGFVTGVDIASDGSFMVCNTDVFNGYIRHAGEAQWRHLLRQDNLAEADYDPRPDNRSVLRAKAGNGANNGTRSEEHTSELQSLMRSSYAVYCLKKKKTKQ